MSPAVRTLILEVLSPVILAASVLAGSTSRIDDGPPREGSGKLTTVSIDAAGFERIRSYGSADIHVEIGESFSVKLTIDDNLTDALKFEVTGKTLDISTDKSYSTDKEEQVVITMPALREIEIYGSSDVVIKEMDQRVFAYSVYGSGDLDISGSVDELDIWISGSGDIAARTLTADEVFVRITGSGDAEVNATESIEAQISNSGEVVYYGKPRHTWNSVTGSGRIREGD